jgi:hypothetical protein
MNPSNGSPKRHTFLWLYDTLGKSENSWLLVFSCVLHLAHGLRYLVVIPVLERYMLAIYLRTQAITQWA